MAIRTVTSWFLIGFAIFNCAVAAEPEPELSADGAEPEPEVAELEVEPAREEDSRAEDAELAEGLCEQEPTEPTDPDMDALEEEAISEEEIAELQEGDEAIPGKAGLMQKIAELQKGLAELQAHSQPSSHPCGFESSSTPYCGLWNNHPNAKVGRSRGSPFQWTRKSGRTPSCRTGPSSAYEGKYYMYIETSCPRAMGDMAYLTAQATLLQGKPHLNFRYHMYGSNIGFLKVSVNGKEAWKASGDKGNNWKSATVDLSKWVSQNVKISFEAQRGGSYRGDIAIDKVELDTGAAAPPKNSPNTPNTPGGGGGGTGGNLTARVEALTIKFATILKLLKSMPAPTTGAPPPATTQGPPPATTQGPPAATTQGPPPATTQGPPPATTQGPPPATTQGPPPATPSPAPIGPKLDGMDKKMKDVLQKLKDYIKNKNR